MRPSNAKFPNECASNRMSWTAEVCQLMSSADELINGVRPKYVLIFIPPLIMRKRHSNHQNDNDKNTNSKFQLEFSYIDTVMDSEQAVLCPIKFLNALDPPGMPPHKLKLKIRSPVLLLRNIDTQRLCNGTRLCVKQHMLVLTWKLHTFRKGFSHICWLKELARQIICILCSNWKNKQYCILESIKKILVL